MYYYLGHRTGHLLLPTENVGQPGQGKCGHNILLCISIICGLNF